MESALIAKRARRQRRAWSVRAKFQGTATKPRLSVFRSNRHVSVQVIDDQAGRTLFALSTQSEGSKKLGASRRGVDAGKVIGREIGQLCVTAGISEAVFDRGCFRYHGVVAAVADGAREAGLRV